MSPFAAHRARAAGKLAPAAADPSARAPAANNEYRLQLVRLGVDLRRLREIQSVERKIELKRELLPEYMPWVEGVLAGDSGVEDDVLTHAMIWLIDIGAFDAAMPLARYVVRHKLTLPERFNRTAPTLIAEEIADSAIKRLGQAPDSDDLAVMGAMLRILSDVEDLVAEEDIFDEVRAKLEKAIGLATLRRAEAVAPDADGPAGVRRGGQQQALKHLRRALELDEGSGVKTAIGKVERELRKENPDG